MAQNEWAVVSQTPIARTEGTGWEVVEQKPIQGPQSAFRQVADVPLGVAKGAVQGVRMIADAFGAGSSTSNAIKSAETYLADLMSAQAKNDQQEISRIMKDAEDKGVLDQVKAGIKAFTIAPVDTLSSALGTAAPVIVGALGAKVLGAGALIGTGVSALTGAGMGAGAIKGSIYEETKRTLKAAGASEEEAERRAQLAQQYNGKNLDQILLGTVLGGAAAVGPLEKGAAGILARRILGKTGVEGTESVAEATAKGALRRRAEAGLLEAVPEAAQAGQEQVAQNIALQREGFDVPTFRGAVSSATLEAIAGGGLGATLGGGRPQATPAPTPPAPEAPVAPPVQPPVAEAPLDQLTPQQKQELERQRALSQRPKTTEELLAEAGIQAGKPTTAEDIARIRDEHETAVIEGLLAQDAEMARANQLARRQLELESEAEATAGGISDVDARVREGRIFARVQDLIDRNIPFASTAINEINQKFGVINEAPLTEEERARIENIMGMVNTFTNFVNLPMLAPKPVDRFAENQAMEALIKERTERGQAEPLRAAPPAPSPRIEKAPVSQGVGEGATLRPTGGVEPSATEDRELVTHTVETPATAAETPAPPVEAAAPPTPKEEAPAVEAPVAPEIAPLQEAYNKAKAALDAIGTEPAKPSSEARYFGSKGREGAAPEVVRAYDEKVKSYNSWRRKYLKLKKEEVEASNILFRAQQAIEQKEPAPSAPKAEAPAAPPILDTTGIKEVKGRHPQVQAAAKLLQDKKMTREEFEKYVDYYKPIEEIEADKLYPPSSVEQMREALRGEQNKDKLNTPIADGTRVGLRMDLPAREKGVPVVSIHEGKPNSNPKTGEPYKSAGKVISYGSTGYLKDVFFAPRDQEKSLVMGILPIKEPLQTAEGIWQNLSPEETYARVKELMKDPAWTQVGFDPSRHGYFYDRKTREPVVSASEMYQVGQFLLAKDVKYAPKTDFLYSLGKEQTKQLQDFQQTLRNLLNKFGLKDVGLNIEEGMRDAGSYSQQLIRIASDEANPIRTLRHEAIHALRELGFFTDAQWKSLSKMAKDKWIDQYLKQRNEQGRPLKAGEESRYDAYMREYNGDMEKITEEAVADAFADFDATKPPAGMLQALLKRMRDLFQSIKSALTKIESPEQIFGKVEKGELKAGVKAEAGERKSIRDRATANFLRWFGDSKVVDEKGEPLVVYHGTGREFTKFKRRPQFFTPQKDWAQFHAEGDVERQRDLGRRYDGKSVMDVYLSIQNPMYLDGNLLPRDAYLDNYDTQVKQAKRLKHDGIIISNTEGGTEYIVFRPEQIKSATANNGEYSLIDADIRYSIGKSADPGQQALETIRTMGMDVPEPDPTKLEKAKDIWTKAKEDPKLTAQSAARATRNFLDKVETWSFSSDAKLNNDYRRAIVSDIKQNEGVIGQLLEMSQSQAVHADALASQFMIEGGLKYNDELKKWESFDAKANFPALSKKLDEIGKQYNLSKEQIERVAHAYLVAKRLPGLIERNRQLDEEIAAEQATAKPDKKKIQDLEDKKVFISDKQLEQMEPGLSLGKTIPELNQVVNMWNDIRKNTIDVMVNSGLWSPEYAQAMWDNMDYVPYFREDQIENEKGPQEFIRGLQVKSKEFQLKGSEDAVHDVFDNMIRWTQYAINRSVRAHKALQMIDNSKDIKVGDRKMAEKVTEEKRGMNIVRVFRDGKQELYDMADPLYVQAFAGIQNVSIPTLKFMSKVSDVLRNSVVLYPLFSVAQVPQDSFAAMFTSGLKTQHALKIPYLAVKEFVKTLAKTSQTHEALKKFGATGVRDFSATVIRDDAEIYAGLKPPRGGWGKTKEFLSHISMAADNAVRQAVYEASIQQGVSRSEAIEKAFEVINFRRKGTSKMLNILGQTVPFFYAYLSAQRVAYKVLTGVGISPTDRAEAFKTLAMTSTAVATLSLLYAMANADDDDYMETPANIRDRTITIPGSGGVRIPLRPDFFLFPKIIAEHTYLLLSEQGYQDAAKFRTSMKDALISAIASPTPFPTAIKPAIEVAINYDFFQGKPLIGNFEKQKDLERQFRDSTSEFSKLLGQTGMISPIAADHLIRGMFGSFGGLFLFGTNQFLHSDPDVPRPEMNATEMLAALPGTSGLLKRPQESALKNDFYTLRDEVEKAVNTFNDIKTRSPEGMEAFLADEKNMARLMLGKSVDKINRELSKIRRQITIVTNMPESQMPAEDKADFKRQLMEMERELLRSVNVKELREMAKI